MDLPERIEQHKAQSDSFAILLYHLKDLGIFRNSTENDYGIDFEIELLKDNKLVGTYIKVQVKSSKNLNIGKKDDAPTVSGIKQSTLHYWAELCYRSHVLAFVVDLKTEKIYTTDDIFWQAVSELDNSNKTKTIKFCPSSNVDLGNEQFIDKIKAIAFSPSLDIILYAHRTSIRHLTAFITLFGECNSSDYGSQAFRPEIFKIFLEVSTILLYGQKGIEKQIIISSAEFYGLENKWQMEDSNEFFNYDFYLNKSNSYGDINAKDVYVVMKVVLPKLIEVLRKLRDKVIKAHYYWRYKDIPYLKLIFFCELPEQTDLANLNSWNNYRQNGHFDEELYEDIAEEFEKLLNK